MKQYRLMLLGSTALCWTLARFPSLGWAIDNADLIGKPLRSTAEPIETLMARDREARQ